MKVGFIILCRYGSTRLPGKILRTINNKPLLQYIYERVRCVAEPGEIVVATGADPVNQPIISYCKDHNISCFIGDQDNVARRFCDCAIGKGFDFAARINGDNLFASPQIIRAMLPFVETDMYDFISNVKERTFPPGMSVEFLRTSFFQDIMKKFDRPEFFEHVTLYLYEHEEEGRQYHFSNTMCPEAKGKNFAIDTIEDFSRAERLLLKITNDHTDYDICDWIRMDD